MTPPTASQRTLAWMAKRRNAGLCIRCGAPRDSRYKTYCLKCVMAYRKAHRLRAGCQPYSPARRIGRPPLAPESE